MSSGYEGHMSKRQKTDDGMHEMGGRVEKSNVKLAKSSTSKNGESAKDCFLPMADRIAEQRFVLTSFLAENCLPYRLAPQLLALCQRTAEDKSALMKATLSKTSAAYMASHGVAGAFKKELDKVLQETHFSVNIDEATNNAMNKVLNILLNYYCEEHKKVMTIHFASLQVNISTADKLTEAVLRAFDDHNIPITNMVSCLLDNCPTMRGSNSGLETQLREANHALLDVAGDTVHTVSNAAKALFAPFGGEVSDVCGDLFYDIEKSPKAKELFNEIQLLLNEPKPLHIMRHCPSRFLQMMDVTNRLHKLLDALQVYYYAFLTPQEKTQHSRCLYGVNSIGVHVQPIVVLLFKEVLSPFYIFQLFSMILWYIDEYEIYASCILGISTISIIITIWQTRKFQRALRNTISSSTVVTVCRGDDIYHDISSEDLVPGDIIEIPRRGCLMQCDAVLISGNCIVNESMLTGESVPITKTSIPNPVAGSGADETTFSMQKHSRHVLFSGTDVIQTRFYGSQRVRAVVLRTGFLTSKGELVRSILYPKPVDFKFQRHSYYFILFLAAMACIGFVYTIVLMVEFGDTVGDIIVRSLDLVTITVPPALPAALAMGIVFAQRRLKGLDIYCISPVSINVCGTVNTVCFDKTGTLTEDGLNMQGVVPAHGAKFEPEQHDVSKLAKGPLLEAMATCHSLTIIEGQLMGDPLDLIMFHATDWVLEEPGAEETRFDSMVPTIVRPKHQTASLSASSGELNGEDIGIVRQFPFSSSLQRMSVITRKLGAKHFDLYVKGSPEMITSLSMPSTVPMDFHSVLTSYTQHGYRVIALAKKQLPSKLTYPKIQRLQRDQVECDLTFLGLLVMENRLKPETTPIIHQLLEANIRTIMVTGDNMLTALSVARECGMVDKTDKIILVQAYEPEANGPNPDIEFFYADDRETKVEEVNKAKGSSMINIDEDCQRFHFAVTGKSWGVIRKYQPDLLSKLVVRGTVFARMSPDQKAQLVEVLQNIGYYVGMCGDGANDCGALKAAHTGISLSEAEASVASPFTSKKPTIECVPAVIKEGRCSLVTAFGIFKYMASYSLTQFTSVLILYWIGANLTDPEFLWADLFIITTLFITFSMTAPCKELARQTPPISLVSAGPILSILSQLVIIILAQVLVFLHIQRQPWFVPFFDNDEDDYECHENAAVFLISAYQYIILSVTFSKGAPFRKTIFSNWAFLINLIICTGATIWITIYPTDKFATIMELAQFPSIGYRALLLGVAIINFLLSVCLEMFVVDSTTMRERCSNWLAQCCKGDEYEYAAIESEMKDDPNWPPVSKKTIDLASIFQRLDSVNQIPPDQPSVGNKLDHILEMEDESRPRLSTSSTGERNIGDVPDTSIEGVRPVFRSDSNSNTFAEDHDKAGTRL